MFSHLPHPLSTSRNMHQTSYVRSPQQLSIEDVGRCVTRPFCLTSSLQMKKIHVTYLRATGQVKRMRLGTWKTWNPTKKKQYPRAICYLQHVCTYMLGVSIINVHDLRTGQFCDITYKSINEWQKFLKFRCHC